MYDQDSKGISYAAGFFMLIAFAVAGVFIASLISIPVWQAMTGISALKMEEAMKDPVNSGAVKVIQCIQAVAGFLLPAIITAKMLNRKPMKLLGFVSKINWMQIGLVCAVMLAGLFASGFFSYINDHLPISASWKQQFDKMESEYNTQVQAILSLNSINDYLIGLVVMAFIPALCEEALFRGGLQNFMARWTRKPWLSIIVVSILFSALHFSFYGFLSRLFLGIVLGVLYEYSGKLWLTVIAHFFNNAFAVTAIYILKQQGKPLEEAITDKSATWLGVFALPVVIALIIVFRKIAAKPKEVPDSIAKNEELRNTPFY
ncbi:MAG TPA: CPBP family intramembrane glutamic endopeptidase [Chitinophagaceae bacterium]|nr:CPBP family intramembrane glutamic endopeptidase [Chitinophagaceae bacterium]